MEGSPTVIVLAAGQGLRFRQSGGTTHKLDAPLAGLPVLQHVLRTVAASGLPFHVVRPLRTGADGASGGANAQGGGMGDSIARGVLATAQSPGWLIVPGDLPLVRADSLLQVAQCLRAAPVVVPQWQGQPGHPVGFTASCRAALVALCGDVGAAAIVRAHKLAGTLQVLALDDPGVVTDIDTVADLAHAESQLRTAPVSVSQE